MKSLWTLYRRELDLAWGRGGGPLLACAFYACVATLLPLAAGPSPERLAAVAPGSAWLALALASLLSLERLFERDYEDGALDLLTLGPAPIEAVAFVKCLAQWTANGLPLAVFAPLAAVALGAPVEVVPLTLACALIGGLGFAFVGGTGAALALGARRGGVLVAVVVLPLFAPPVIFGAGTIEAFAAGLNWTPGFAFLAAYSLAAVALTPLAMGAAVRNALS
ncbi:heme exporter protein CcmB [Caulobacter sp. 17J80-11]|uniref:heme exporter protein CcmB n=1 Tax=Caulobacter sp. 17J80-11 TaxID=2763502 RepID=UPI001653EB40|nr:heme exporter protein CcmB [Caulobacter sp. 17J80-11]